MFKDVKYLFAYIAPLSAIFGFLMSAWWYYAAFVVGFIIIPILETSLAADSSNFSEEEEAIQLNKPWFDFLIYLNFPLLFYILYLFLNAVTKADLQAYEMVGLILSMSVIIGSTGINVAHELGHRENKFEQIVAKVMLIPALYMHFFLEHNLGHHKNIATDEDPASAKYGESVYRF